MTAPAIQPGVPLSEILREALANLRARGQRSGLALLGIVIGTAAIIALMNIGYIAQVETLKQFARLGVDVLQVRSQPTGEYETGFDRTLVEKLPTTDPDILDATPFGTARGTALRGARQSSVVVLAAPPKLATNLKLSVSEGRLLTDIDDCLNVAVVGADAAAELMQQSPGSLIDQDIAVGDYLYTVIGVLKPTQPEAFRTINYNDALMIPLRCARRIMPGTDPNAAFIRVREGADVDAVGERVTAVLSSSDTQVQVINAKAIIAAMNQQKVVHSRMLAAIGAISLLVGGIGVMNVMLMNVMERRREIGLRAAIGATPRDIQLMFLLEAAMLATTGGVLGALFGLLATAVVAKLSAWSFLVAWYVLPIGPGSAALIGLIFGLYPAITASRIDPIEALRAD